MGISIPTLPIANKYTKDTTIGMGAIKGAAAQFGTPIPTTKSGKTGNIVPLIYEDNEGEQHTDNSLFIADGVGISSIEKTSTSGNVDTYTITLTDGSTTTFQITNGVNGKDGKDGVNGADGKDGKDGVDGAKGDIGKGIKSIDAPDPNKAEIVITYDDDTESDPIEIPTVEGHDEPLTPAQINTLIALL